MVVFSVEDLLEALHSGPDLFSPRFYDRHYTIITNSGASPIMNCQV